ncbi:MAG: hypothetical protein IT348_04200 [Candidatus Eisenbacteria bacterium]|nr:hypothetical protein [Candidatus Eisenbacteria bacterium]
MSFIARLERRPPGVCVSLVIGLLALFSVALVASPARAQAQYPTRQTCIVDGVVTSLISAGDVIYVGGWFSAVGQRTGTSSRVHLATGTPDPAWPAVCGEVYGSAPDGQGGWFLCGNLIAIGQQTRLHFAHIRADGSLDPWDLAPNGRVGTLLAVGSTLYLGGSFTQVGGQARTGIAAVDMTTHEVLPWNVTLAGTSAEVTEIAYNSSTIFIAGFFASAGGQLRNRLAAIDRTTAAVLPWNPALVGPNSSIVLAASETRVYLGGWFTGTSSLAQRYLVALDAITAAPVAWNPAPNTGIDHIAIGEGNVYVGGPFSTIGGEARNCVVAFDEATLAMTAWNPDVRGNISGIIRGGNTVYVSGNFQTAGGASRRGVAALDATTGLATAWNPSPNGDVYTIGLGADHLFVGGQYSGMRMVPRTNLAAIDAVTGTLTAWAPTIDQYVDQFSISGSVLYAAGGFSSANGQPRAGLAAFQLATGALTAWNPAANGRVATVVATPEAVFVGGSFTSIGGQPRERLAALSPATAAAGPWNPGADIWVSRLLVSGSTVYVTGDFTTLGGLPCTRIGALDAASGARLPFAAAPNGRINAIARGADGPLFVTGDFSTINGQARVGVAALDALSGNVTPWYPATGGESAIAMDGSTVYLSGNLRLPGGQALGRVAAFDGVTGEHLPWAPYTDPSNNQVLALATHGGLVYVGGFMMGVSPTPNEGLLVYSTSMDETPPAVQVLSPNGGEEVFAGLPLEITWDASDDSGISSVALRLSRNGPLGPWEAIATGVPNSGHYTWTITGPAAIMNAFIRVDVADGAGNTASDLNDAPFTITTPPVPTLLELFRAQATDDGVLVEWKTALPSTLAPQRGAAESGEWTAVNAAIEHAGDRSFVLDRESAAGRTTWYRLQGTLGDGSAFTSAGIPVTRGASVSAFALSPLAPNPFVNRALVSYALPVRAHIRISMVDIQGREVARLVDGECEPGRYTAQLDAQDLRAGIYYLRMEAPGVKLTQRAVLLH